MVNGPNPSPSTQIDNILKISRSVRNTACLHRDVGLRHASYLLYLAPHHHRSGKHMLLRGIYDMSSRSRKRTPLHPSIRT
jgi:hypothetical protein